MILEILQTLSILLLAVVIVKKIPNSKPIAKTASDRKALLDSCALIDGRIVELAKAGFVPESLEVPEFIIAELQLLADGNDSQKRERARYGLEIVQQLQQIKNVKLTINRTAVTEAKLTDDKLVKLAKRIKADLYTTDFNLNQVANIEGVRVLNVNELAHALRTVVLPGETITIKVVQIGSSRDQGVGYLDDGTMVVIDNAKNDIGRTIEVKITRSHQTVAGRMIFGTKVDSAYNKRNQSDTKTEVRKKLAAPKKTSDRPLKRAPTNKYRQQTKTQMTEREKSLFDAIDNSNDTKIQ